MDDRSSRAASGGRARGIMVGSLIAFGWWLFGTSIFTSGVRFVAVTAAMVLTVALFVATARLLRRIRTMPPATPTEIATNKRVWRWFWLNLIGEIVLLNVAVSLLGAADRQAYFIPAISAVVGLHFLPMAVFFRARSYWFVGIAMMAGAVVAALFVAHSVARAADIAHIEGLANAMILWSSLGLAAMGHRSTRSRPV